MPIWGMEGNLFPGEDVGSEPKERIVVVEVIDDGSDV